MSSLNSKLGKDLSEALAGTFATAAVTAMIEIGVIEKGREPFSKAKVFVKDIEYNPDLEKALKKVMPADKFHRFIGVDLIENDHAWKEAVDKLGVPSFNKHGMSFYFLEYFVVLAHIRELIEKNKLFEKVMEDHPRRSLVALALASEIRDLFDEGEKSAARMLGLLAILEDQIPENPKGVKEHFGVWLWKKANGATKPDYARARKAAEDFFAASASNTKVSELAAV